VQEVIDCLRLSVVGHYLVNQLAAGNPCFLSKSPDVSVFDKLVTQLIMMMA
jgi:hypothetical protein